MKIGPKYRLSRFFTAGEFFPRRMLDAKDGVPAPELYLTRMVCLSILDSLRATWGTPITINARGRQNCGWRDRKGIEDAGSMLGSDHSLIDINAYAHGACDLHVTPRSKTPEFFEIFATMQETRAWPWPCREIILEESGRSQWVHVSWPGGIKTDAMFQALHSGTVKTRRPRPVNGKPWRYYRIVVGKPREPVTADLTPLT